VFFGGGATVFKAMSLTPEDSDNIDTRKIKTKEKKHYLKLFKGVIASFIVYFVVTVILSKHSSSLVCNTPKSYRESFNF
jgi:hypothetical protein